MKKKNKKPDKSKKKSKLKYFLIFLAVIFISLFLFLLRKPEGIVEPKEIKWGVAYSRIFCDQMGIPWKETYLAILDDLKPQYLRLPVYWQDVEKSSGDYDFTDYDFMVSEAEKRGTKLILVMGRKTPRWPECNLPDWVGNLDKDQQKKKVLELIEKIALRYKDRKNIYAWQVENEPFLPFGDCKLWGGAFLDKEIADIKSIDKKRPVIVTDSGELSIWLLAAKRADIFGTTMYRIVHSPRFGYVKYPFPPRFFWFKANLVHLFYPEKPLTVSELQAEPWGPRLIYDISVEEQMKTMNFEQFQDNIKYAEEVGFPEVYLWGAEWWWWMKTKQSNPSYWEEARKIIQN